MSNFTPGPWNVEQVGMDVEISSDNPEGHLSVAWVHIGQGADIKDVSAALKDAALIAAAPDLYAALEALVKAFKGDEQMECGYESELTAALTALAKADGKPTKETK